jgi:hypothetical protein
MSSPERLAASAVADPILGSFLERMQGDALELAEASDIVDVRPIDGPPPTRYLVDLLCRGLVREASGEIREADRFTVGLFFPPDYLRRVDPARIVTILAPLNIWHPNVLGPLICLGRIEPGTGIVDLLYQVY